MRRCLSAIALVLVVIFLAGCGETVHGAVKDTRRIGGGIRQVFVRD